MIIIGLTGEQASGKGTVAEYIVKKFGAKKFQLSRILDDILERIDIPNERINQTGLATALRSYFGENILAQVLAKDIIKEKRKLSLIDGIRFQSEYKIFKKTHGFKLIYITAPLPMRYKKIIMRGEKANEKKLTLKQFQKAEKTFVTELHIPSLGKIADFRIDNIGTKKDLYRKVDEVMKRIGK